MVFVLTKKDEGFLKLLFCVSLAHFGRHDSQEIIVIYWDGAFFVAFSIWSILSWASVSQVRNKSLDFFFCWLKTQSSEGNSQLFDLDGSRAVGVKKLEGLLNLVLLSFGQLLLIAL